MDIQIFKSKYIEEAVSLLDKLENYLVDLEKSPADAELIENVFRVMHTLKGTSGMYGFDTVAELTHKLEDIYNLVRDNVLEITADLITLTLKASDYLRKRLTTTTQETDENKSEQFFIETKIQYFLKDFSHENPVPKQTIRTYADEKMRTWHILFYPSEEIVNRSINIMYTFADLLNLGEYRIQNPEIGAANPFWSIFLVTEKPLADIEDTLIFVEDYCKIQHIADFNIFDENALNKHEEPEETPIPANENVDFEIFTEIKPQQQSAATKHFEKISTARINVDSSKLDYLMFLVSELVTTKSELVLSIEHNKPERTLESAQKIDKLSKMFRDNALDIRLISMQEIIGRFKRLVRDLSVELGKKIVFETVGEDVELDKNIVDSIAEPILHLLRNCIDHGIETPEQRIARNKPDTGIIKLFAYKSGNFVFIQISDDGNGIDKEKVLRKAVEKGLVAETEILSDKEIFDLIFRPGFTTAENLSMVSGLGVGMDIVRKKIQEIRGEISVDSETGLGTSFTLKLQQSISIIDTLLIQCENTKLAVPLEDIESCSIVNTSYLNSKHNRQIDYQNELIPYINLRREFQFSEHTSEKQRLVVINKHEKRYAILTDFIIGEYQAVVKPLGDEFAQMEFLSGAGLLGDGSIALLLDTDKLRKSVETS